MELHLKGKRVLITGGSAGIGRGIALAFAQEGCNLVLVSRSESTLSQVARDIEQQFHVAVEIHACDLRQDDNAPMLAQKYGDIDILVNNAGDIPGGRLTEVSQQRWREGWELKVFGFINMTRSFYKIMSERGHGVILNIIGASSIGLDSQYIAGSMGNSALEALTHSLGSASPEYGVRVLGISPGLVLTERLEKLLKKRALDKFGNADQWQELTHNAPFHRTAAVDEIAASAVFLASSRSSYTSGAVLSIDGGFVRRHNWWG